MFNTTAVSLTIIASSYNSYYTTRRYFELVLREWIDMVGANLVMLVPMLIGVYLFVARQTKRNRKAIHLKWQLSLVGILLAVAPLILVYTCTSWINTMDIHPYSILKLIITNLLSYIIAVTISIWWHKVGTISGNFGYK